MQLTRSLAAVRTLYLPHKSPALLPWSPARLCRCDHAEHLLVVLLLLVVLPTSATKVALHIDKPQSAQHDVLAWYVHIVRSELAGALSPPSPLLMLSSLCPPPSAPW